MNLDNYNTNKKEYLINLSFIINNNKKITNYFHYNYNNYYKNKDIILQEFYYLLNLYNI